MLAWSGQWKDQSSNLGLYSGYVVGLICWAHMVDSSLLAICLVYKLNAHSNVKDISMFDVSPLHRVLNCQAFNIEIC